MENALKLPGNKRVGHLPEWPEGQGVLDFIGNGGEAIRFAEPMGMNPQPVGAMKLFVNEMIRRLPQGNPGLPAERNAAPTQPKINDRPFGDSDRLRGDGAKAQLGRGDPLEIGGITEEVENLLYFKRKFHGSSESMCCSAWAHGFLWW